MSRMECKATFIFSFYSFVVGVFSGASLGSEFVLLFLEDSFLGYSSSTCTFRASISWAALNYSFSTTLLVVSNSVIEEAPGFVL